MRRPTYLYNCSSIIDFNNLVDSFSTMVDEAFYKNTDPVEVKDHAGRGVEIRKRVYNHDVCGVSITIMLNGDVRITIYRVGQDDMQFGGDSAFERRMEGPSWYVRAQLEHIRNWCKNQF